MTKFYTPLIFILGVYIHLSGSAKILGIINVPFQSHINSLGTYFKTLAQRGHNVTVLTAIRIEVDY